MGRFGLLLALLRPFLRGGRMGARGIAEMAPGVGGGARWGRMLLIAATVAMLAPYIDYDKVQTDLDKAGTFVDAHDEDVIAMGEDVMNAIAAGGASLVEWVASFTEDAGA